MKKAITLIILIAAICSCTQEESSITILHTNDTHSHFEPEKDGRGGLTARAALIKHIKDSVGSENTLLFDCGDFSQGSLYYNVYKGAMEIEAMNLMGYDAGTIGNHEFDFGLENIANLVRMADFPILSANLIFDGTVCEGLIKPYTIIERNGRKIGVFALSPNPEGLVLKDNYRGVTFRSPIEAATECVKILQGEKCELIICLSHLGWKSNNGYCDEQLATETEGIDIILGGHSHDYFEEPLCYKNRSDKNVVMQQAGKYGRYLGTMEITFR